MRIDARAFSSGLRVSTLLVYPDAVWKWRHNKRISQIIKSTWPLMRPEHVYVLRCLFGLDESMFYVTPNMLDDVAVRNVGRSLENSKLLLGKPLLAAVCTRELSC